MEKTGLNGSMHSMCAMPVSEKITPPHLDDKTRCGLKQDASTFENSSIIAQQPQHRVPPFVTTCLLLLRCQLVVRVLHDELLIYGAARRLRCSKCIMSNPCVTAFEPTAATVAVVQSRHDRKHHHWYVRPARGPSLAVCLRCATSVPEAQAWHQRGNDYSAKLISTVSFTRI
jgi:hypothetical protein